MNFFGLKIPKITKTDAWGSLDRIRIIYTPNPEILMEAHRDHEYLKILKGADLLLPDGKGLQFVSTLKAHKNPYIRAFLLPPSLLLFLFYKKAFQKKIPEIIHGSDFMPLVVDWAEKRGKSVFFLGASPGIAKLTALFFQKRNPNIKIAGFSHLDPNEKAAEVVKKSKAQVLFVAYGAPKQEKWIDEFISQLKDVEIAMAVGGSFDFYSGKVKRAPKIMQQAGLEWLWRLILNPKKRIKRIYTALIKFPIVSLFYDVS